MDNRNTGITFNSLARLISLLAGYIILIWFIFEIAGILLLLLYAIVIAIIINAPVTSLQNKKIPRMWACVIVFGIIIILSILLGWLVIPKIRDQVTTLFINLPAYLEMLTTQLKKWFGENPIFNNVFNKKDGAFPPMLPSFPDALLQISNYSLSLIGYIVIFIVFISMVAYMVISPEPLVQAYLSFFSLSQRDRAATALSKTSVMLVGWMRANIIGGTIEAIAVTAFLSYMGIPGAFVWGALAFVSVLVPKIGFFIMFTPPVLIALTINISTAVWVVVFFLVLDEILGDFVMPKIRSNTMNIHPVSSLFLLLIMGSAFGFKGVLIATPLAAIIKAYYEEFYLNRLPRDERMQSRMHKILNRNL